MNWVQTEFLVLRKIQHTGSNLVVAGVSPDSGRLSFYVRGSGGARGRFSSWDLFRKLRVGYHDSGKELLGCSTAEVLADYSEVARDYRRFCVACALARFSLDYAMPGMPCPLHFRSLEVAFHRLARTALLPEAVLTGAGLVFLQEAGWLGRWNRPPEEAGQTRLLLDMALGDDIPRLAPDNWKALWQWTEDLLRQCECPLRLPDPDGRAGSRSLRG